jgi:hypothetical protein
MADFDFDLLVAKRSGIKFKQLQRLSLGGRGVSSDLRIHCGEWGGRKK